MSSSNCTCLMLCPVAPVAAAVIVINPDTSAPAPGDVIATDVTLLFTVMLIAAVVLLFAVSVATAVSVCTPLLNPVTSTLIVYGAPVTAPPWLMLSSLNCTPLILNPLTAAAVAVTTTWLPDTVAPFAGTVIETLGLLLTVIPTAAELLLVLLVSVAIAVTVCDPLLSFVVSSTSVYGAAVTGTPWLALST